MIYEEKPKVFISYTWDNELHRKWVERFASDLIESEIKVMLDKFDVGYGDCFMKFMISGIRNSNFFLFISTNKSREVADVEDEQYEKRGLWFELKQARTRAQKQGCSFKEICVLREGECVPSYFGQSRYVDLRDDAKYRSELNNLILELKYGRIKPTSSKTTVPTLIVNDYSIDYIRLEYPFLGEKALSAQELQCVYEDVWTPFPSLLDATMKSYIEQKRKETTKACITFDNNLSYSLYAVSVEREQKASGLRNNRYIIHLRPTNYFSFVFPNLALDETIDLAGIKTTPREVLDLAHHKIRIENLADYSCHFHVGTGTILITNDNKIVISIRSRLQFVVGGSTYHLSTAEGMLRTADEQNGIISPFFTSIRSLKDELGLEPSVDFQEDDIRCLGLVLDTLRAQPVFFFYIKSSLISFDELKQKWQLGRPKDKHENKDIIEMEWNKETARILLGGHLDYHNTLVKIASNHAQTGFMLATIHEFGEEVLN